MSARIAAGGSPQRERCRWAWGLLLVALWVDVGATGASASLVDGSKALAVKQCIAPIAEMRRNHMKYLRHDRAEVVRQGNREGKASLAGCVDCHAGRDAAGVAMPVNGRDAQGRPQFCAGCHEYVGLRVHCFECHRKVPAEGSP